MGSITPALIGDKMCAFIDGSSLETMTEYLEGVYKAPARAIPDIARDAARFIGAPKHDRYEERPGQWLSYAITLLASTVGYDMLLYDDERRSLLDMPKVSALPGVQALNIPGEMRAEIAARIDDMYEAFGKRRPLQHDKYFVDKGLHDRLSQNRPTATSLVLASSTNSASRLFYTTEIAGQLEVPFLLHPVKAWLIGDIQSDLRQDLLLLAAVEEKVAEGFFGAIPSIGGGLAKRSFDLPPLEAYLLRYAREKGVSLLDAAAALRETNEAKAFRKWLKGMTKLLASASPVGQAKVAKELKELGDLSAEWGRVADSDYGVRYELKGFDTSKLEADKVPSAGLLAKLAAGILKGLGLKATFKDPILDREEHLVFISRWFA